MFRASNSNSLLNDEMPYFMQWCINNKLDVKEYRYNNLAFSVRWFGRYHIIYYQGGQGKYKKKWATFPYSISYLFKAFKSGMTLTKYKESLHGKVFNL